MRWRCLPLVLFVLILAVGCSRDKPWVQAGAQALDDPGGRLNEAFNEDHVDTSKSWTGHVTAYGSMFPPIPNARLQPPAISASGDWVAYLAANDPTKFAGSDGLITGKGLGGISLWVRELDNEEDARAVALSGACWPTWSHTGDLLAFVVFDQDRRSTLGLYDVNTGKVKRKAVGLRCILMPAFNRDGTRIAVSAYGEVPDQALIFVIDPVLGQAHPGPPTSGGAQLMPRWVGNNTLLFVELTKDAPQLKRWTIGDSESVLIADLPGPDSIFDAQNMLAGIDEPVRPDIGAYTYYNMIEDRIEMLDLTSLTLRALPSGFRGGAWWGDDWLVASSDDRIELASSQRTSGETQMPRMIRLITGRWLPVWADYARQSVVLIGEGEAPDTFSLMRVWLVADDHNR